MGRRSNKQKKHLRSAAIARAGRKYYTVPTVIEATDCLASDTENAGLPGTLSNANPIHLDEFEGFDDEGKGSESENLNEDDDVCSWPGGVNNHVKHEDDWIDLTETDEELRKSLEVCMVREAAANLTAYQSLMQSIH